MAQKINWCDVDWVCEMEGGRIIHPDNPWFYFNQRDVEISHDLRLSISYAPRAVKYWNGHIYHPDFGCGLIRSVDEFGYGTFTAEIKLPKGKNLWPSFWLCGVGKWPDNGEIDICEAYCDKNGSYFKPILPRWKTTNNIHYANNGHKQCGESCVSWFKQTNNPSNNYIKYQCEWRPNTVIIRVNDKVVKTYGWDIAGYLVGKKMKVIFNLFPSSTQYSLDNKMIIKYFKYESL